MNTEPLSPAPVARGPGQSHVAQILFLLLLTGGVLVPWSIWLWFHFTPNAVLASADVGRFVSASKGNGGTNVQTTEGTIAIDGTLSALRGSLLVVQRSTKRGTELCVADRQASCVALAGPWTAPLQRIPGSGHATDFYAHGISAYSLRIWRMFGFLLAFGGLAAASVEITDNHPEFKRR